MSPTPDVVAALIVGLTVGAVLGVIAASLIRRGRPVGVATQRDVMAAYVMGHQDAREGLPLDTTRPAELYP